MGIVMRMVGGTDLDVGGDTEGRFIHDHPDHSLSDTVRESSSLSSPQAEPLHTGATQVSGDLYDRRCDSGRTQYVAETGGTHVSGAAPPAPAVVGFNYSTLAVEHADSARSAAELIRARTSAAILDTGRDLVTIKGLLDHGQFGGWLRAEFGMSIRTAQDFMRAAALADAKYAIIAYLKLPHFRGVFGAQDDCGCAMASSIVSSNVIGDR